MTACVGVLSATLVMTVLLLWLQLAGVLPAVTPQEVPGRGGLWSATVILGGCGVLFGRVALWCARTSGETAAQVWRTTRAVRTVREVAETRGGLSLSTSIDPRRGGLSVGHTARGRLGLADDAGAVRPDQARR